jgi:hypothetical protein
MITRETLVEELVPLEGWIAWCVKYGFSPFSCQGAYPGNLGKLMELKRVQDIDDCLARMNQAFGEALRLLDGCR